MWPELLPIWPEGQLSWLTCIFGAGSGTNTSHASERTRKKEEPSPPPFTSASSELRAPPSSQLPRALPRNIALEYIATGAPITPARGYELGMVNRIAPKGGAQRWIRRAMSPTANMAWLTMPPASSAGAWSSWANSTVPPLWFE